jgi:hypothetical protein
MWIGSVAVCVLTPGTLVPSKDGGASRYVTGITLPVEGGILAT